VTTLALARVDMKLLLGLVVCLVLSGCPDSEQPTVDTTAEQVPAADVRAGMVLAERDCRACHGLDGVGTAPALPHLAGQRERYLVAVLTEYARGKRAHTPSTDMVRRLSDTDIRNVAVYYATLPQPVNGMASAVQPPNPYEQGRRRAAACATCHGADGNAKVAGTPSLAGQQPHYLVAAMQRHHQPKLAMTKAQWMLRDSDRVELENLALYFAAQVPVRRSLPPATLSASGGAPSTGCGGCHGALGVSNDAATPSLAGQDFHYLGRAIRAYRAESAGWGMHRYVEAVDNKDVEKIAAYYAAQEPSTATPAPSTTQQIAEKCDRCHSGRNDRAVAAPNLNGQDKDYLAKALRAYRDGRRDSNTMHNISFTYSNTIIESLATWYSSKSLN